MSETSAKQNLKDEIQRNTLSLLTGSPTTITVIDILQNDFYTFEAANGFKFQTFLPKNLQLVPLEIGKTFTLGADADLKVAMKDVTDIEGIPIDDAPSNGCSETEWRQAVEESKRYGVSRASKRKCARHEKQYDRFFFLNRPTVVKVIGMLKHNRYLIETIDGFKLKARFQKPIQSQELKIGSVLKVHIITSRKTTIKHVRHNVNEHALLLRVAGRSSNTCRGKDLLRTIKKFGKNDMPEMFFSRTFTVKENDSSQHAASKTKKVKKDVSSHEFRTILRRYFQTKELLQRGELLVVSMKDYSKAVFIRLTHKSL